jgi:hypothetical protein
MTRKEVEALFPRKCLITQQLIDSKINIGTQLLKDFLPENMWEDIFWGLSIGTVAGIKIKTETESEHNGKKIKVPLYLDSHIQSPIEITFELRRN